jgi:glycosyltransferase involved in cell wall biosynthesis
MIEASGVGVYLRECLPYLLDSPNSFVLLGDEKKLTPFVKSRQNSQIITCTIKPFSLAELWAFPRALKKKINKTDLYYSPYFNIPAGIKVPVYTTIHDIIFPDMPELVSKPGLAVRMWFYRRAAKKSKKIFTVSRFSKSRIEYHLGNSTPVTVTYNAAQSFFSIRKNSSATKEKIVLFIGNIKKHKGLRCLLDAFFLAKTGGLPHKLVIVGSKDHFRSADGEMVKKLEHADSGLIEFTGFIPNEQLKALLLNAALLVQPSLYEGFGYPPLEAMSLGTSALISDIPVFREIYDGFPVTFFRAGDAADLKEKMMALLTDNNKQPLVLPDHLRNKYTFKKTASIIMDALAG